MTIQSLGKHAAISYSGAFRELIASKGQHIDELLTYKEPDVMVELIKNGYASEHYEEWKTHKDKRVREALAQQGFWPEDFIEDENRDVRAGVVMAHPEMMRHVQNSEPEWENVKDIIENDPNVTVEDMDNEVELFKATFGKLYHARDWVEYNRLSNEAGLTPY